MTEKVSTLRYRIVEQEQGVWVIAHPNDTALTWAGSHWQYRDQAGPALISFASEAAARNYAVKILGANDE